MAHIQGKRLVVIDEAFKRGIRLWIAVVAGLVATSSAFAPSIAAAPMAIAKAAPNTSQARKTVASNALATSPEARLLEVFRLIRATESRKALAKVESLTRDVPNFHLAQLVYADLLLAQQGRADAAEIAPPDLPASAAAHWKDLRREAAVRLAAITERPPENALPRQFIDIPPSTHHAIAVDASRSRMYLFENSPRGLRLVSDHYVSLGRQGTGKKVEGDQRTPLGVYFITGRLHARQLKEFYGPGALTLNYPNEYDRRQGKTGGGIWLHGVPRETFARAPQSTDGCVVLANLDINQLLRDVVPRNTPVVITQELDWVPLADVERERIAARAMVEQWRQARSKGDASRLLSFYSPKFASGTLDLAQWTKIVGQQMNLAHGRESELKDLSILAWRDSSDVMIVTFGEILKGQRNGPVKRQYWSRENGQWKIFFEGVIG